jgi:hypothetical protein
MGIEITNNKQQADMARYVNPTRVASVDAVALHLLLEQRKPSDLKVEERAALDEVKAASEGVRSVRIARQRSSPAVLKEPRNQTCTAVASLHGALTALSATPFEIGPEGAQAAEVVARVFPDGTGYLRGDAIEIWEGTSTVLQMIDTDGLGARIDALVHPTLLRAVRSSQAKLGRAIGVTGDVASAVPSFALREAMSRFTFAVAQYARVLAGRVRHDDKASLTQFLAALSPLDSVRVLGDKEEDEGLEPTPTPAIPVNGSPDPVPRST